MPSPSLSSRHLAPYFLALLVLLCPTLSAHAQQKQKKATPPAVPTLRPALERSAKATLVAPLAEPSAPVPSATSPTVTPPAPSSNNTSPLTTPTAPAPAPPTSAEDNAAAAKQPLTPARTTALQISLERRLFSCGTIDGTLGSRTRKAILAFQEQNHLPHSGEFDTATRSALGEAPNALIPQTLTPADFALVSPTPTTYREKAKVKLLGYNTVAEMLGEKFHSTPEFIQSLNPGVDLEKLQPGATVTAPNITPQRTKPEKCAHIHISLTQELISVYSSNNVLIAQFPCSIAKDKAKRPVGTLHVLNFAPNPNYTFNPTLLKEAAAEEKITKKMVIPPGPNNPVGLAWIGLDLPGYGMHGTPEPEKISLTESHGCFRLANWNAAILLKMIRIGTPVDVEL